MQKKSGFEPISYADLWFSTTNNSDIGYRNIRISVKKKNGIGSPLIILMQILRYYNFVTLRVVQR